jgi:toxin YoeB
MEVILNDISVHDLTGTPDDARQAMNALLQVCKKAKDDLNCNGLRLPNADFFAQELVPGYTLIAWMTERDGNRNLQTLFNGLRRFPYYEGMPEEAENEYMLSKFSLNEPEHPVRHEEDAQGLANAYLQRTLAVGFCSHDVWSKCKIGLTIQKENADPRTIEVHHACTESCIDDEFKDWFRKAHLPPLRTHEDVDVWFPIEEGYLLSEKAKDDLIYFFEQNQIDNISRIEGFFEEIWIAPFRGSGMVEPLKHNLSGWWSRRITHEHRLVYKFEAGTLLVCSCRGHYSDLTCE